MDNTSDMNWFGKMLYNLFPPEKEAMYVASDDFKRYHRYLGNKNSIRYNSGGDWMQMKKPGEDVWRNVPPLAEWLSKQQPR